ncbi:immunoglobulin-like domain-containing protein, partial [Xanthomarina sp. GH4-25]|uniref:immunoglobulin-like domain-containing protein n=1 Tax=Xanthomarina sp. GH4-25 TaxID=3349335 RepID=UPI0038782EDF
MKKYLLYLLILTTIIFSFDGLSKSIDIHFNALHNNYSSAQVFNPLEGYLSLRPDINLTRTSKVEFRNISSCPTNFSQNVDPGTCGAVVTFTLPTTDIVSGSMVLISALGDGDTFPVGTTTVTYEERDAGNIATGLTCSFNVTIVDNEAPTITLNGANPQTIEACGTYNELGATANDTCFGDITGNIVIDASAVNTAVVGSYNVTYNVTDANGNPAAQVTRTVNVVDNTVPTITLVGANPQTIEACGTYNELGATANDPCFGDISGSIVIDASAVNTAVVGSYNVTYNVTDANGNPAAQVTRTVNVVDNTVPTITLVGANPQTIEACGTYNELGATANDPCFGDITSSIVIDASAVNTALVGSYSVTYNVMD